MAHPWILAARPKTLVAAVVPVLVGTSMAGADLGGVNAFWAACALFGAILIQIGTNLVNDALDFAKGVDSTARTGPVRVTQAGLLRYEKVMGAAWVSFGLAVLCGIPLVLARGLPLVVIGLASIAAGYAYTGGPYPLSYHGLGELFVIAFFGVVAVGGSYYVQTGTVDHAVVLTGIAVGLLATVILAINNLRDLPEDRATGKRTMAVRFGESFARGEIVLFAFIPFVLVAYVAATRGRLFALLSLGAIPLAVLIVRGLRLQGEALNQLLASAALMELAFGLLFAAGFLLG